MFVNENISFVKFYKIRTVNHFVGEMLNPFPFIYRGEKCL